MSATPSSAAAAASRGAKKPPEPPRARPSRAPGPWRVFRTAALLGWRIESNWADPVIFAIYSIAKPLAAAAILVVMYTIITHGNFNTPIFSYMYVGNAFYIYVTSVVVGISWAVIEDRERYQTMKYIYAAPLAFPLYLVGRAVARLATGTLAVVFTLMVGVLAFQLPIHPASVDWPLFAASFALGLGGLSMIGLIIAGITMLTARHYEMMGEAVAGALMIVSGALFPLSVLPGWLKPFGYALPITWWLELTRRSLLGPAVRTVSPAMARFGNGELLALLFGMTLGLAGIALIVFRLAESGARDKGLLDKVTNY